MNTTPKVDIRRFLPMRVKRMIEQRKPQHSIVSRSNGLDEKCHKEVKYAFNAKLVGQPIVGPFCGQGNEVALSPDGKVLAVSATLDDVNFETFSAVGAIFLFERKSKTHPWNQVQKIIPDGIVFSTGSAVLSEDGSTLAFSSDSASAGLGLLYVYHRTCPGGLWVLEQRITSPPGTAIGNSSNAIDFKGHTLAVGGFDMINPTNGLTFVFVRIHYDGVPIWVLQAKLVGSDQINFPQQGISVAISGDGSVVASGGPFDGPGVGTTHGAVWVWRFDKELQRWVEEAKLIGTDADGSVPLANQGISVALNYKGDLLAEGGPADNNSLGATWIFAYDKCLRQWKQQAKLVGQGGQPFYSGQTQNQGNSLAFSPYGKGETLSDGAPGNLVSDIGGVYVFKRKHRTWVQEGATPIVPPFAIPPSAAGFAVSLGGKDDEVLAFGGLLDNSLIGATWMYDRCGKFVQE